ncbi:MAG: radical SAM protein, partial [Myxococcota bacterium]
MRRLARSESFGAIVSPPFTQSLIWLARKGRRCARPLSAPVEVHVSITADCPNRCPHCYEDSVPDSDRAKAATHGLEYFKGVIDVLGRMKVFHCAMGGGEPALVPWLFELGAHARKRGIVPNLTTSGAGVDRAWAKRSGVFGQVN